MTDGPTLSPLYTDLYELTMAAAYHAGGMDEPAVFSLFTRPQRQRNYFVAAGLAEALAGLSTLRFSRDDLDYLSGLGLFDGGFLARLERFRFSGSVRAMPEGTIFFAHEPVLEVTAPVMESQLVETFLLNTMGFQTLIASKAARCVWAAEGRSLVDFSARRTQGLDAGLKAARGTYIAGFEATSNTLAGRRYGIPVSGTMAHSFVSAFDSEPEAFAAYARTFPDSTVFLIDTYDTIQGARNAAAVAMRMKAAGHRPKGVRLDSGDMADLSRRVRKILDDAGLEDMKIFASGGFDEFKIAQTLAAGASIDAFGVGTQVGVSADAPSLDIVYKMVRYGDRDVRKLSPGKITLAGEKQVFRDLSDGDLSDVIGTRDESVPGHRPLLEPVMTDGRILDPLPTLTQIRGRFAEEFSRLPRAFKSLRESVEAPVTVSRRLQARRPTR